MERVETNPSGQPSTAARRLGLVVTALVCAQLAFSAGIKLLSPEGIPEHFSELGWRMHDVTVLAFVELACTLLYVVPRTSLWGAVLLTGYLGGAIATHVRIGDGVFPYPLALGVLVWLGPYLRDMRVRRAIRAVAPAS